MRALLCALLVGACAIKGYDLGWRKDGRLSAHLGAPLDALSGCAIGPDGQARDRSCAAVKAGIETELSALPAQPGAPEVLGARCRDDRCSYANVYERRDVGTALILPVYKRIVLREARLGMVLAGGRWQLDTLSIRDNAPPGYGPVRIGGVPASN